MNQNIAEKDWKHLRALHQGLIERYCLQTLSHIRYIVTSDKSGTNLQKYQEIYQYIEKREETLIVSLNDFRRSNAIYKIVGLTQLGLFLDEEYDKFSDEVKLTVKRVMSIL